MACFNRYTLYKTILQAINNKNNLYDFSDGSNSINKSLELISE